MTKSIVFHIHAEKHRLASGVDYLQICVGRESKAPSPRLLTRCPGSSKAFDLSLSFLPLRLFYQEVDKGGQDRSEGGRPINHPSLKDRRHMAAPMLLPFQISSGDRIKQKTLRFDMLSSPLYSPKLQLKLFSTKVALDFNHK